MTDLLDAVDRLTLPERTREAQDFIYDGHIIGTQTTIVTHAPLLTRLGDAVAGSIGAGSSKGSLDFERNVLDADALYILVKIEETIRQWCNAAGVRWGRDPAAALRAWYAATLTRNWEPAVEKFYLDTLTRWERTIHAKLDPPRERELPDRCPICGSDTFWRDGAEYRHPLVVRYRPLGADLIQHARAVCRACATVWRVRELAYTLEHPTSETEEVS
jgi:hypothetical protein